MKGKKWEFENHFLLFQNSIYGFETPSKTVTDNLRTKNERLSLICLQTLGLWVMLSKSENRRLLLKIHHLVTCMLNSYFGLEIFCFVPEIQPNTPNVTIQVVDT